MNNKPDTPFDSFEKNYNFELTNNLNQIPFQKNISHFAEQKIRIIHSKISTPHTILEYGCGIGRNIEFLISYFPDSIIYGTDISTASLNQAKSMNKNAHFFHIDRLPNIKFDLILVSDVLHHIQKEQLSNTLNSINKLLNRNGNIFIFEQNPYNPVTRYLVKTCIFDKDATLLTPKMLKKSLEIKGFKIKEVGFCFFFPSSFSLLHKYELSLTKLPLGGKYFIWAQ